MSSFTEYVQASFQELQTKVTWPTWRELQESSVLVFVASLLIAFIVSAMDWVFGVNAADSVWSGVVGLLYQFL
ncbi:MAG: preprotein translocase subunit SecE [Flavobacteriales bacterium]